MKVAPGVSYERLTSTAVAGPELAVKKTLQMILLSHFHIEIQAICSLPALYFRKPLSYKELQKWGRVFFA
jgi:hypothetical protein